MLSLARASLPFQLTGGQEAALEEVLGQMAGWPPMQCLLQVGRGDPGRDAMGRPSIYYGTGGVCSLEQGGQTFALLVTLVTPWLTSWLQGDVGCGKTVVALLALLAAAGSGYQGALMVGGRCVPLICLPPGGREE